MIGPNTNTTYNPEVVHEFPERTISITAQIPHATGAMVLRHWNGLEDYQPEGSEESDYSPEVLTQLGVAEAGDTDKLIAIANANDAVLDDVGAQLGVAIPAHRYTITSNGTRPQLDMLVDKIIPAPGNDDPTIRFGFVPGAIDYYRSVGKNFVNLIEGEVDRPMLFHADLANPNQYRFGAPAGEEPKLTMMDIAPEVDAIAFDDEGEWHLSPTYLTPIRVLSAVAGQPEIPDDVKVKMGELLDELAYEGVLDRRDIDSARRSLAIGNTEFIATEAIRPR